jgi:hypothetical protein
MESDKNGARRPYEPPRVVRLGVAGEGSGLCNPGSSTTTGNCETGYAASASCRTGSVASQFCSYSGSTATSGCYLSGDYPG